VSFPQHTDIGSGYTEEEMAQLYNMFDVFTLPTGGEGFGLPILEAMSCGVPTVVTNYSGHTDFVKGVGDLINVGDFLTDMNSGIERAIVDIKDYYARLERLYYDADVFLPKWKSYICNTFGVGPDEGILCGTEYREMMGRTSVIRAREYEWRDVLTKWSELFKEECGLEDGQKDSAIRIEEV
jgi:glycosyltransferase involved in cell wall biosynthesis